MATKHDLNGAYDEHTRCVREAGKAEAALHAERERHLAYMNISAEEHLEQMNQLRRKSNDLLLEEQEILTRTITAVDTINGVVRQSQRNYRARTRSESDSTK